MHIHTHHAASQTTTTTLRHLQAEPQREAHGSPRQRRKVAETATAALVVATRAAVDRCVLATVSHHSYSKVDTANAALRGQKIGTSTGGVDLPSILSSRRTMAHSRDAAGFHVGAAAVGKMERHGGIGYELVLTLDAPVLQMVDQLVDVVQFFDTFMPGVAEQVIEVQKILEDRIPSRKPFCEPQLVEQLVEVPTVPQTTGSNSEWRRRSSRFTPRTGFHSVWWSWSSWFSPGLSSTAFCGAHDLGQQGFLPGQGSLAFVGAGPCGGGRPKDFRAGQSPTAFGRGPVGVPVSIFPECLPRGMRTASPGL